MLLVATDPVFALHDTGRGHPERPARLAAVIEGVESCGLTEAMIPLTPRDATLEEIGRVHSTDLIDDIAARSRAGGGYIDGDTVTSADSYQAAVRAAGAGLAAVAALRQGLADAAFLALRPPGHHATPRRSMGFCLFNNVAVTAAALAAEGERVLIVDYDAHHGNGTQDIFWADPRVLYVSFHEWPLYPGTGRLDDTGAGPGDGTTCNLPFPAGTTGDVYLHALDEVVAPLVERFDPTWVLVSAGFDAHRDDPLTGLGLTAADYATITERVAAFAPEPGRLISFLEGGYDLGALTHSVAATLPVLVGSSGVVPEAERASNGGPGRTVVDAAIDLWHRRST